MLNVRRASHIVSNHLAMLRESGSETSPRLPARLHKKPNLQHQAGHYGAPHILYPRRKYERVLSYDLLEPVLFFSMPSPLNFEPSEPNASIGERHPQ